ncbi:hypothetical protein MRB53_041679 [Persea americana]|nr:hypothetical protein MRB53_041679 [Persea americana]
MVKLRYLLVRNLDCMQRVQCADHNYQHFHCVESSSAICDAVVSFRFFLCAFRDTHLSASHPNSSWPNIVPRSVDMLSALSNEGDESRQ